MRDAGFRFHWIGPVRAEPVRRRLRVARGARHTGGVHRVRGARAPGAPARGVRAHRRARRRADRDQHRAAARAARPTPDWHYLSVESGLHVGVLSARHAGAAGARVRLPARDRRTVLPGVRAPAASRPGAGRWRAVSARRSSRWCAAGAARSPRPTTPRCARRGGTRMSRPRPLHRRRLPPAAARRRHALLPRGHPPSSSGRRGRRRGCTCRRSSRGCACVPRAARCPPLGGLRPRALERGGGRARRAVAATPSCTRPTTATRPRLPRRAPVRGDGVRHDPRALPRRVPARRADPARHKAALCGRADRVVCISRGDAPRRAGAASTSPAERVRVALLAGRDWADVASVPVAAGERALRAVGGRAARLQELRAHARGAGPACREAAGTTLLCVGRRARGAPHEAARLTTLGVTRARAPARPARIAELRWAYEHAAGAGLHLALGGLRRAGARGASRSAARCVASDLAPLREVGGDEAIYVEPYRARERCARAPPLPRRGAQRQARVAARRAQAARFSWDACAARHEAVYRELD